MTSEYSGSTKKKKKTGSVYFDYMDLNEAYLNDSFPLSRIDEIVDAIVENGMLSFLDAFFGYNQILMHPPDLEKSTSLLHKVYTTTM